MPLSKLVFKPGINREGTNYSNEGGWNDGDKIRFRYGYPEKIGGWEKVNPTAYEGTPRFIHDFVTLASQSLLFIGTEKKTYLEESGTLYDITPFRRTVALPYSVTGVSAGGSPGSVTVIEGTQFDVDGDGNGVLILREGVSATGEVGALESVTAISKPVFPITMTGEVGGVEIVTVVANQPIILRPTSVSVTEFTNPITSSVGTVTVVAGS